MKLFLHAIAAAVAVAAAAAADAKACLICSIVMGLSEQAKGLTPDSQDPDTVCSQLNLCDGTCKLWPTWPVQSPTNYPVDGAVDARRLAPHEHHHHEHHHDQAHPDGEHAARQQPPPPQGAGMDAGLFKAAQELGLSTKRVHALQAALHAADAWSHLAATQWGTMGLIAAASGAARAAMDRMDNMPAPAVRGGRSLHEQHHHQPELLGHYPACDDVLNVSCDISRVFDEHLPLIDADNDYFTDSIAQLRGFTWRGKDCNDTDAAVHPGANAALLDWDAASDSNCNGIHGGDESGPYEKQFCSGEDAPMSVIALGDSALAHFHLPAHFMNAHTWSSQGLVELATNEVDWPSSSWATGFSNATSGNLPHMWNNVTFTKYPSFYERMVDANRCNHRAFQNIGVNGARIGPMADKIINSAAFSKMDSPALVILALIGDDICVGHYPPMQHVTPVADYKASAIQIFDYLDTVLAAGSHVAIMPQVDGRVLYNTVHNRTHPLGMPTQDLWDALTCMQVNPCPQYLTTNATLREEAAAHGAALTDVYRQYIAVNGTKHQNFDMHLLNLEWADLLAQYAALGYNPVDLIEPAVGMHPTTTANALVARQVWMDLAANTTWLPRSNPANAKIQALFGDQGGY